MQATLVVGNPKLESRTRAAGAALVQAVLGAGEHEVSVIELATLSGRLFSWGDAEVAKAKATVLSSDLVVFASPVYKASCTGLLKAFLDQFGRDELRATATVPLMVGASPAHSLAVEAQLRPVLIEIGASCPTRGVYLLESEIAGVTFDDWLAVWGSALTAVMRAPRPASGDRT